MTDLGSAAAVRVDPARLEAFCAGVYRDAGCGDEDAAIAARVLVSADVRGTHTHGTHYLPVYAGRMRDGTLNARPVPRLVRETPSAAVWDGDNGLGHVVAHRVVEDAIAKVEANGNGVYLAVVRRSHHFGAAGYFALMAAEAGLVGLSMSSTLPVIAAPGARGRTVGNGPFAWAVPGAEGLDPMVFDVAWSTTAGTRLVLYARRGEPLPEGWLLDPEGRPTTDGSLFRAGGAMTPLGAHKGYGMALLVEILSALLAGGTPMRELDSHFDVSHAFLLVDPAAFVGTEAFAAGLAGMVEALRGAPKAEGSTRIMVPGDPELEHAADSHAHGLELGEEIWSQLVEAASAFGRTDELEATKV